jgi:hypothetical protein
MESRLVVFAIHDRDSPLQHYCWFVPAVFESFLSQEQVSHGTTRTLSYTDCLQMIRNTSEITSCVSSCVAIMIKTLSLKHSGAKAQAKEGKKVIIFASFFVRFIVVGLSQEL